MDDEIKIKQDAIYAGIGTGAFGILMGLAAWNVGLSNITGQGCGAISVIFIAISIASFLKPELVGPVAMQILKNQQKAFSGSDNQPSSKTLTTINVGNVKGSVITTVNSMDTDVDIIDTNSKARKKKK